MRKDKVSQAVIHRLPRYYRYLDGLYQTGAVRTSSSALARKMGLTASQIRQDLSCFGGFGQQGYGYNVERLRAEIAEILGMDRDHTVVILGAGNLGRALIENFPFQKYGFHLEAAFDIDPAQAGREMGGIHIYHPDELGSFLRDHSTDIGILTLPGNAAARGARRLADGGIKGIWNFTNVELPTEELSGIHVENIHFSDSLLTLSYFISEEQP